MKASKETKQKLAKVCSVVSGLHYQAAYFSILDCPDGKIRLYYRGKGRGQSTHVRESDDGITFSSARVIFSKSHVCHNFSPFIHDGKYYAVGGQYKHDGERRKRHAGGLYLLHSNDGLSWDIANEKPIITPHHPGFIQAPFERKIEFDGSISCVPYQNKFYLYFRANVGKGIRAIQYSCSDDLIHWSEIKIVHFNPKFEPALGQNLYGPYFFNFEGIVMGFIPFFVNKSHGFIAVCEPDNSMGAWNFKGWFNHCQILPPIEKNRFFPVSGIIRNRHNRNMLHYYVHDNYFRGRADKPVSVDLYIHKDFMRFKVMFKFIVKYPHIIRLYLSGKFVLFVAMLRHQFRQQPGL